MKILRPIIGVTIGLWLLVGLIFPLAMTGISQITFPWQANGSVVRSDGRAVAALHIGQNFTKNDQFWGRPSATTPPYNPLDSGPSNLGPTNKLLIEHIKTRIHHLLVNDPGLTVQQIPASMVESSGSGLDPDITVQGALIQVPRVAHATGLSESVLDRLIKRQTLHPLVGVIGVTRINVVELNLALAQLQRHRADLLH